MIHAQVEGGTVLEFPDDTPQEVVDRAVKEHVSGAQENPEEDVSLLNRIPGVNKVLDHFVNEPMAKLTGKSVQDVRKPFHDFGDVSENIVPATRVGGSLAADILPWLYAPEGKIPMQMAKMFGVNAASRYASDTLGKEEGGSVLDALKQGGLASILHGGVAGGTKLLGKVLPKLSGIDPELYAMAKNNPEILGGKFNPKLTFEDLADKASTGLQGLEKENAKTTQLGLEQAKTKMQNLLSDTGLDLNSELETQIHNLAKAKPRPLAGKKINEVINAIDEEIKKGSPASVQRISPQDVAYLERMKSDILGQVKPGKIIPAEQERDPMTAMMKTIKPEEVIPDEIIRAPKNTGADLQSLKQNAYRHVYDKTRPYDERGEFAIKNVATKIRKIVDPLSQPLESANRGIEEFLEGTKGLERKLSDSGGANFLSRFEELSLPEQNSIKHLGRYAPPGDHFLPPLMSTLEKSKNFESEWSGLSKKLASEGRGEFLNKFSDLPTSTQEKLSQLSTMVPKEQAFADPLKKAVARNAFESWKPNISPYHGTALGAAGMGFHMMGVPSVEAFGIPAALALTSVPKLHKFGIQGVNAAEKMGIERLLPLLSTMTSQGITQNDESTPDVYEEYLKRRR